MATTTKGKLFYAKVSKGYTLKATIDALAAKIPRTSFTADKTGFYHRNTDEPGHILVDINFPRGNFREYACEEPTTFSLSLTHLRGLVKNVKKKDSIIMFISKTDPDKLGLAIQPSGMIAGTNTRTETVYITIVRLNEPQQEIDLPETFVDESGKSYDVYHFPKVVVSQDFQKAKKLVSIGKVIIVKMQQNNYLSLYSDNGDLYSAEYEFGEIVDGPDDDSDDIKDLYQAEFHGTIFSFLAKIPGLCSQIQFFAPRIKHYPLKVGIQAGELGFITIYIKDRHQIELEQESHSEY